MHAWLFRRQERSLQVNPEHPRLGLCRFLNCGQGWWVLFPCIGDKRRQKCGGSVPSMRSRDGLDGLGGRRIVEENVSSAIDLKVYETRGQPGARGEMPSRNRFGQPGLRQYATDVGSFNDNRGIFLHRGAVKNMVGGNGVKGISIHLVRVTFCKFLGASTFKPRWVAM